MQQKMKSAAHRQANYELLRIIAMAMVITLHYLGKGGLLKSVREPWNLTEALPWILQAFCIVAVDVYVLISGYFLVDAEFKPEKLWKLWAQIFFYSMGVPAVLILTGILPREEIYLERLFTWCFPVLREHYWFATAYVVMYLFAPFLGKAVRSMTKKQLRQILCILLAGFSLSKSILPIDLPMDTGGYDAVWFLCLFLTAAYIRLYGAPFLEKHSGLKYVTGALGLFGLTCVYKLIYMKTGRLNDFLSSPYQYNHILCLFAAAALFCAFGKIKIRSERAANLILKIAPCTFGIYLLHENDAVRYLWPNWILANQVRGTFFFVLGDILAVIVLFGIGIIVELCRQWIFGKIFRNRNGKTE